MHRGLVAGVAVSLSALAFAAPAVAKVCVEPYGELVAVSDVETVVRIKPECAALASLADGKDTEKSAIVSALLVEPAVAASSPRPKLPEPIELAARPSGKRTVSCSDPAVCGTPRVAKAERLSRCEYGRAYAVGVSDGLTEVRVYDDCRYLMNPAGPKVATAVPAVLAPDWELDTSPRVPTRKRRARAPQGCSSAGNCNANKPAKATEKKPSNAAAFEVRWSAPVQTASETAVARFIAEENIALRTRRYLLRELAPGTSIS